MNWLFFALLTVVYWGIYGVFLHKGQVGMADQNNGRYMAFLYVGIAYFLVAVLGPIVVLKLQGGRLDFWSYPAVTGIAMAIPRCISITITSRAAMCRRKLSSKTGW